MIIENFKSKNSLDSFQDFCNIRNKTDQDIFEVFKWETNFLLNWFTELSWRIGYLWNIKDNIPFFLKTCKKLNMKANDCDLKNILLINYNLIRNYFSLKRDL